MTAGIGSFEEQPIAQPPGIVNPLAQIGIALSQFPQMQQNAQMRALALQAQKTALGKQLYSQIGDEITADPTLANDPARIKRAMDIARQTGLPPPVKTDEHGNQVLNLDLLTAHPDVSSMTMPERQELFQKIAAMPTEDRAAALAKVRNVPPEWLTAKQYTPLNAGAATNIVQDFIGPSGAVAQFKAGKLDPTAFAGEIEAMRGPASQIGGGFSIDQFLTPEFLASGTSQWANAQIDWLHERGIHLQNADATAKAIAQAREKEAIARIGLQGEALRIHEAQFQANQQRLWATHIDNLGVAQRNLQLRSQSLQSLMDNRQFMQNIHTVDALAKPISDLRTQFDSANTALAGVAKAMATNAGNGFPPSTELQAQYDALSTLVSSTKGQLDTARAFASHASDAAHSGTAGVPVRGTGAPSHTQPGPGTPARTGGPDPSNPPKPGFTLQNDGHGNYRWYNKATGAVLAP